MSKTCIIIAGPTAVGKTSLAIELASTLQTQIISADSRQCYQELNIAVAKPSTDELARVHHYFINSHHIHESVSAADFESYALNSIGQIFQQHDVAVMVGGTGLYIKAFCEGLDLIPAVDAGIRLQIASDYDQHGLAWLQEMLRQEDPVYYANGEVMNPQRMMRALEVKRSSGQSITEFQNRTKKERPFNIIKIGLELPRPQLYDRINTRVDDMMKAGLEEEARGLLPYRHLNALQTVGYKELFAFFDGNLSVDAAVALLKQNSRHYAKRQLTWFKKDEETHWLQAQDPLITTKILGLLQGK